MSDLDQFLDSAALAYDGADSVARREPARAVLGDNPRLAEDSVFAAAALHDLEALRKHLEQDRAAARRSGGPRNWPPLLYLCYSRVTCAAAEPVACMRLLLEHGADPAASFELWDSTFTALTGVMGEGERGPVNCPPQAEAVALAELLLDAGVPANESQGLYNTMFRESDTWLKLLLARGLNASDSIRWGKGDEPRPRMLDFLLSNAVDQGYRARIALLLEHGANPNANNPYNGRALHLNARIAGRADVVEQLEAAGAQPGELTVQQRFSLAVIEGDADLAGELKDAGAQPQDSDLLRHVTAGGMIGALELLADLGADLDLPDDQGVTPLHTAAVNDRVEVVRLLLARGADRGRRDKNYDATPLGWAEHTGKAAAAALLRST